MAKKTSSGADGATASATRHFELGEAAIPIAFQPTDKGAQAALAAAARARALLTELDLLCAGIEIKKFFKAHPGIESFQIDEDWGSDDEGGSWIETRTSVDFMDATNNHDQEADLNDPVE